MTEELSQKYVNGVKVVDPAPPQPPLSFLDVAGAALAARDDLDDPARGPTAKAAFERAKDYLTIVGMSTEAEGVEARRLLNGFAEDARAQDRHVPRIPEGQGSAPTDFYVRPGPTVPLDLDAPPPKVPRGARVTTDPAMGLFGDSWVIPPEVAAIPIEKDFAERLRTYQILHGERKIAQGIPGIPDGTSYVEAGDELVEIPRMVEDAGGIPIAIADRAGPIFNALTGTLDNTALALNKGSLVGAIVARAVHQFAGEQSGRDFDVPLPGGGMMPLVPAVTGHPVIDRENLQKPAYLRALADSDPGGWRKALTAFSQGTEFLAELALSEGAFALAGKGVGAAARGIGAAVGKAIPAAQLSAGMTAKALLNSLTGTAETLRKVEKFHFPGSRFGLANFPVMWRYGVLRAAVNGESPWEGFKQGTKDAAIMAGASVVGNVPIIAGKAFGLGQRFASWYPRKGPAGFLARANTPLDPLTIERFVKTMPSGRAVADEVLAITKSQANAAKLLQWYDMAAVGAILGGLGAAEQEAAAAGVDFAALNPVEQATRVAGSMGSPHALGTAMSFLAGGAIMHGLDAKLGLSKEFTKDQEQRLQALFEGIFAEMRPEGAEFVGAVRALRAEMTAAELGAAHLGIDPSALPKTKPKEGEAPEIARARGLFEHVELLLETQRAVREAYRDELAEADDPAAALKRHFPEGAENDPRVLKQIQKAAEQRTLFDAEPTPTRFGEMRLQGKRRAPRSVLALPEDGSPRPAMQRGAAALSHALTGEVRDEVASADFRDLLIPGSDARAMLIDGAMLATGGQNRGVAQVAALLGLDPGKDGTGLRELDAAFPVLESPRDTSLKLLLKGVVERNSAEAVRRLRELDIKKADGSPLFSEADLAKPEFLLPFVMAWAGVPVVRSSSNASIHAKLDALAQPETRGVSAHGVSFRDHSMMVARARAALERLPSRGGLPETTVLDMIAGRVFQRVGLKGAAGKAKKASAERLREPLEALGGRTPFEVASDVFAKLTGQRPAGLIDAPNARALIGEVNKRLAVNVGEAAGRGRKRRGRSEEFRGKAYRKVHPHYVSAVRRAHGRFQDALERVGVAEPLNGAALGDERASFLLRSLLEGAPWLRERFAAVDGSTAEFDLARRDALKGQQYAQEAALLLAWPKAPLFEKLGRALEGLDEASTGELSARTAQRLDEAGLLERIKFGEATVERPHVGAIASLLRDLDFELLSRVETASAAPGDLLGMMTGYAPIVDAARLSTSAKLSVLRQAEAGWVGLMERWYENLRKRSTTGPVGELLEPIWKRLNRALPLTQTFTKTAEGVEASKQAQRSIGRADGTAAEIFDRSWKIVEEVDHLIARSGQSSLGRLFTRLVETGAYNTLRGPQDLTRLYGDRYGPHVEGLWEPLQRYVPLANEMGRSAVRLGLLSREQFASWKNRYVMRIKRKGEGETVAEAESALLARGSDLSTGWRMSRNFDNDPLRTIADFSYILPRQAAVEATQIKIAQVLADYANPAKGITFTHEELDARGVPEHVRRVEFVRLADPRPGDPVARGIHAFLAEQRAKIESGKARATPAMESMIARLLDAPVFVERGARDQLKQFFDLTLGETPGGAWEGIANAMLMFRRGKTALNPRHLFTNFVSSPMTNSETGGLPVSDWVNSWLGRGGIYHDVAKVSLLWRDWVRAGRDPAALAELDAESRAFVLRFNEGVKQLGGSTMRGMFLENTGIGAMVEAVASAAQPAEQTSGSTQGDFAQATMAAFEPHARSMAGIDRRMSELLNLKNPDQVARAISEMLGHYQLVELYFKLSNAEHFYRRGGISWEDAVYEGSKGTANYADASPVLHDLLSNWHGREFGLITKARNREKGRGEASISYPLLAARPLIGRPFLSYQLTIAPSLAWGIVSHPQRALVHAALLASAAAGVQAAMLAAFGRDEEEYDESLAGQPGYTSDEATAITRAFKKNYEGEVSVLPADPTGALGPLDAGKLVERMLSPTRFEAFGGERAGKSRTLDLSTLAPAAQMLQGIAEHPKHVAANIEGLARAQGPAEQARTLAGTIPLAAAALYGNAVDVVRGVKGRTGTEVAASALSDFGRAFGAEGSPHTWFLSQSAQSVLLQGGSIRDVLAGIQTNEETGPRALTEGLAQLFRGAGVSSQGLGRPDESNMGAIVLRGLLGEQRDTARPATSDLEATDEVAARRVAEQTIRLVSDAYAFYFRDRSGFQGGLDAVLASKLDIGADLVRTDGEVRLVDRPRTDMGRFLQAQEPEVRPAAIDIATRFLSKHVFDASSPARQAFLGLARKKAVAPEVVRRIFRASLYPDEGPLLELMLADMKAGKDENVAAYYYLWKKIPVPQSTASHSSRQRWKQLRAWFMEHHPATLEDVEFPGVAPVLGPAAIDLAPGSFVRERAELVPR